MKLRNRFVLLFDILLIILAVLGSFALYVDSGIDHGLDQTVGWVRK